MWQRNRRGPGSMRSYTGFCQQSNDAGTIWIETFKAPDLDSAIKKAQKLCAEAWYYNKEDIHVLGILAGDVEVLHWEDLNEN